MRWFFLAIFLVAAAPPPEVSTEGMVASDHALASAAGAQILEQGGNAVDAVIAAALAAGVVQPAGSGLGGGGFAVVVDEQGHSFSLDFREIAPAKAHRDLFVQNDDPNASRTGALAVAVPGESKGLIELHRKFGSLPLEQIAKPAIVLAEEGFAVGHQLHSALQKVDSGKTVARDLFGLSEIPNRNAVVYRPRLAKTLRDWAKTDGKVLTKGWVAKDIVRTIKSANGLVTHKDLKTNQPRERVVLTGTYRGWKIYTMGPPSSGGLVLLQSLSVLEGWDLAALEHNTAELLHLYGEVLQHAFADRANFMGDPDRVDIPIQKLLAKDRISEIRSLYSANKTLPAERYGTRIDIGDDGGTQHISVIDANGMAVSLTTTINTLFGSKVIAPKSGIVLNNEMDDFVARPGEPNSFGLIGAESNSIAAGAVPLSSMTPTILVSQDGKTKIAIGASGGPFIISSTLQAIVNIIDFKMNPSAAVSVPRIHHQWVPRKLFCDQGISKDTRLLLGQKGHDVNVFPFYSSVQVVVLDQQGYSGASDPRKGGWPVGFSK